MRIHTCGEERVPVVIMLPGSFCNADTMMNIIMGLEAEFHILAVDYNGQYPYAQYRLVSGYGHVGYPGEHPEEYCGWLSALARGEALPGA